MARRGSSDGGLVPAGWAAIPRLSALGAIAVPTVSLNLKECMMLSLGALIKRGSLTLWIDDEPVHTQPVIY